MRWTTAAQATIRYPSIYVFLTASGRPLDFFLSTWHTQDTGCTVGHATLPYKELFPEAEAWGINVGAPVVDFATEIDRLVLDQAALETSERQRQAFLERLYYLDNQVIDEIAIK